MGPIKAVDLTHQHSELPVSPDPLDLLSYLVRRLAIVASDLAKHYEIDEKDVISILEPLVQLGFVSRVDTQGSPVYSVTAKGIKQNDRPATLNIA